MKSIDKYRFWNSEALIVFECRKTVDSDPIYVIAEGNHRVYVCKLCGIAELEFLIIELPIGMMLE